jgi:hypothetical protein
MMWLGLVIATAGLTSALGSRSVMAGGFAEPAAIMAYALSGLWVLSSSVLMIRRSWRRDP